MAAESTAHSVLGFVSSAAAYATDRLGYSGGSNFDGIVLLKHQDNDFHPTFKTELNFIGTDPEKVASDHLGLVLGVNNDRENLLIYYHTILKVWVEQMLNLKI